MADPVRVIQLAGATADRPATPDSRQLSYWDWEAQVLYYVAEDMTWVASGGGGGAPSNATYITQTPNGTLTNEQALSVLATGLLKSTTATGVVTISPPQWGHVYSLTPPVLADYTAVNQGGATLTQDGESLVLEAPSNGGISLRLWVKAMPVAPFTVTALISVQLPNTSSFAAGLVFRDSGSGSIVSFGPFSDSGTGLLAAKWDDENTFDSSYGLDYDLAYYSAWFWLRINDDGANRNLSVSLDRMPFVTINTHGNTDFITADQIGFFMNVNSGFDAKMRLISWEES